MEIKTININAVDLKETNTLTEFIRNTLYKYKKRQNEKSTVIYFKESPKAKNGFIPYGYKIDIRIKDQLIEILNMV